MGVVVRRYMYIDILIIIITFPTPLVLARFLAAASYFFVLFYLYSTSLFILKMFFRSCF